MKRASIAEFSVSAWWRLCAKLTITIAIHMGLAPMGIAQTTFNDQYLSPKNLEINSMSASSLGEHLDLQTGGVSFSVTDVQAGAVGKLPLSFGRKMDMRRLLTTLLPSYDIPNNILGDKWLPDLPMMEGDSNTPGKMATNTVGRCTSGSLVPSAQGYQGGVVLAYNFSSPVTIQVPGREAQAVYSKRNDATPPSDGGQYLYQTVGNWMLSCLPSLKNGNGEGFVLLLPDGSRYTFDWIVVAPLANNLSIPGSSIQRVRVRLFATHAVDRFGNYVDYTYDPANPSRIVSIVGSNGARIDFAYNAEGNISQVMSGGRVWGYFYRNVGSYDRDLAQVVLPDQSSWSYSQMGAPYAAYSSSFDRDTNGSVCNPDIHDMSTEVPLASDSRLYDFVVTVPSGAAIDYTFRVIVHGQNNVVAGGCPGNTPGNILGSPKVFALTTLVSKTVSGAGLPSSTWIYRFMSSWSWSSECASGCGNSSTTIVKNPSGSTDTYTYGNDYQGNYGQLLSVVTQLNGVAQKTVNYQYLGSASGQPFPDRVGGADNDDYNYSLATRFPRFNRPLVQTAITQDGVTFTNHVDSFDSFARPVQVTKKSGAATP